jgi:DUF1680 family protein
MLRVIEPVPFSEVKITDDFWNKRLQRHASVTLPVCIDQIEHQTARIRNFENVARKEGKHEGIYFDDSDVYKAMEGMAYSLINNPNPKIEAKLDEWIDKIAAAQQPDGYINTYYTLTGLDQRWTNMDKHEMYCGGHMIEAAIAYFQATGKRKFLDVAIRFADHVDNLFGPGKKHWITGHQEIELALVKLYHLTKENRYLKLADWLLEERGHGYGSGINYSYTGNKVWWADNPEYCQDNCPVREQSVIAGHAVRAMYMYCGMADVASLTRDQGYVDALNRLWESVVMRNMYITGGIGSSRHNEGFTEDYDLPNEEAYCETCASVGMVFWNHRMNNMSGDAKYIDVLERSLYNGALAGISLEGDRFFYVNPLESRGNHHRQAWYGCACCPSQISRFLPSIGSYIYGKSDSALWVNLFIASETEIDIRNNKVALRQETAYPWDGKVTLYIDPQKQKSFSMKIRKPQWTENYTFSINGEALSLTPSQDGYLTVTKKWKKGDRIEINWEMDVQVIAADPRVKANTGKRALQRGPLVYCIEEMDNPEYDQAYLSPETEFQAQPASMLGGVTAIRAGSESAELNYIPYYAWDNREAGKMRVWVNYIEQFSENPEIVSKP